jgi:hypothetical protein
MPEGVPFSISASERAAREGRILQVAGRLGFVGRYEYRHQYSQSGGAQFGLGKKPENDVLIVYAEGSLLVEKKEDQQSLLLKAQFEATKHGMDPEHAAR